MTATDTLFVIQLVADFVGWTAYGSEPVSFSSVGVLFRGGCMLWSIRSLGWGGWGWSWRAWCCIVHPQNENALAWTHNMGGSGSRLGMGLVP